MIKVEKIIFIIALLTFLTGWSLSFADIYKYVDENGVIHFTNTPENSQYKKIISESKPQPQSKKNVPNTAHYHQIVRSKSAKYNVEPSLVKAVIKTESNWDAAVVSQKGAMGLMQLMPSTANDMDVRNPFNPEENIEGGIRYLRYLLNKFDGDITLALAAYNAGPKTVEKFGSIPPIPETQQYVKQVLSIYKNGSKSGSAPTIIYKVIYNNGTILYTNTPFPYEGYNLSKF
ncbi:MAG: lytic transglycosylase domain-containing protein [Nitrospirae bacterium]|nr:lytic transglycosylase domain-containing protein [Nitrospirota bacterium]